MFRRGLAVLMTAVMIMTCTQNVMAAGTMDPGLVESASEGLEGTDLPGKESSQEQQDFAGEASSGASVKEDAEGEAQPGSETGDDHEDDDSGTVPPGEADDNEGASEDASGEASSEDAAAEASSEELEEITESKGLVGADPHVHCVCGSETSCGAGHNSAQQWTEWESTTSLPTEPGYYYLAGNVTLESDTTAEAGVYLCTNGKTVDLNGKYYYGSGKLAITNCQGKAAGGFFCSEKSYSGKPAISAKDLELRNITVSLSDMTGTVYGVGYKGNYGDQAYLLIDNCDISMTGSTYGYLVTSSYSTNVTMKDTTVTMTGANGQYVYGVDITGYTGKVAMSNCTVSVTGSSTGMKALSLSHSGDPEGTTSEVAKISNCSFSAKTTSTATNPWPDFSTATSCASGGAGYFTFDGCSFTSESEHVIESHAFELECGVTYAYQGYAGKAVLNNCTATATSEGLAYALHSRAHLTMNGGRATATGTSDSAGLYIEGSYSGCEHILSGVTITGTEYGIYESEYTNKLVSVDGCTITATDEGSYGISIPYGPLYLGGNTQISGGLGSIYKTLSVSYSGAITHCPAIYAYSYGNEDNPLTIASGKTVTVYYAYSSPKTGDLIINGGMTAALVGKLTMSYPAGFSIDKDGKLVTPVQSSVNVEYNYQQGQASAYKNAECTVFLPSGKAFEGDTVYIEAKPETHYIFDGWVVNLGGVTLADATAVRTSFVMGATAVTVRANFKEAPSYAITYNGGSQSDGTVTINPGKKYYDDEYAILSGTVFKNKDAGKSQTGWALTDGGEKAYALGGQYTENAAITLYPYWEANHSITIKYGDFPAEEHTSDEVVFSAKKVPGTDYSFIGRDIDDMFGYESAGTASSPYYYVEHEDENHVIARYRLVGFSVNADGSTCDYTWVSGSDIATKYTAEADVVLYPAWERMYRISYAPGTYGVEREEPLEDQFKRKGATATLPGRINTDKVKIVAYERREDDRDDYSQGGWSVNADGSTKNYNLAGSYSADADVILYPYWEPIYRITYLPGEYGAAPGGEEEIILKKYVGVSYNIYYGLFTRAGFTQTKWNTAEDGSGQNYNFGASYSSDANLTLYPVWEENHTITYVPDDKSDQTYPVKEAKIPGRTYSINGKALTAKGYKLKGYATEEGSAVVAYEAGNSYSSEADLTLYPVWEAETYALRVGGVQVTTANKNDILGDGKVSFDPAANTLTLSGVNITEYLDFDDSQEIDGGEGISVSPYAWDEDHGVSALNLVIEGENTLVPAFPEGGGEFVGYGINASGLEVTVSGTGSLTVGKGSSADYPMYAGIMCSSFRMKGATLNVYGRQVGIYAMGPKSGHDAVTIEGGTLNATALGDGGVALGCIADNSAAFRILDGTVNLTTTGNGYAESAEHIQYPAALAARANYHDAVLFEGGSITLTNSGEGHGIEFSNYGESSEEGDGEEEGIFKGFSFYATDVTISSGTATIATEMYGNLYTVVYLGEGVSVKAGDAQSSAAAVTDFATAYGTYKYAEFTGGQAPERVYLYVGDEAVTSDNLEGEGWSYVPATSTLTVTDLDLDTVHSETWGDTYGIYAENDLNLVIAGSSSIGLAELVPETGVYSGNVLTVSGTGYLGVFGTYDALRGNEGLVINSGTVDALSDNVGIYSNGDLTINGGKIKAESTGKGSAYSIGLRSDNDLIINGGDVSATGSDDGIYSYYDVYVTGGKANISSFAQAVECDTYYQSGGEVSLVSTGDDLDAHALNPVYDVELSGGTLYAEAQYTAVISERTGRTITIDGGLMQAHARSESRYNGTGITTTIQYKKVVINNGRLEVSGYGYGIYGDKNSTSPNVSVNGGSILVDMTPSQDSKKNYAITGSINVNMPSSRYCRERGGKYYIRTGSYSFSCNNTTYEEGTDYVSVSAVQTVDYRPGTNGVGDGKTVAKDAGAVHILEDRLFTYTGHVQSGWNTSDDGTGTHYDLKGQYTRDADLVLYPEWAEALTLTYKPGSNAAETEEYPEDVAKDETVMLRGRTYTRDGYVQTGWNTLDTPTQETPGTHYDLEQQLEVSSNLTLYPEWTSKADIRFTLTLSKGTKGKGTEPAPVELALEQEYTLPGALFTRPGYKQTGWALTDDGEKIYEPEDVITLTEDLTLFPSWGRSYTLMYVAGGSPGKGTVEKLYDDDERYSVSFASETEFVIEDALFEYAKTDTEQAKAQIGWTLSNGGHIVDYEFGQEVTLDNTTTLYPVWLTDGLRIEIDDAYDWEYVTGTEQKVFVLRYTGSAQKPAVKVYDGGTLLKEKTDYTISFKNNTNAEMTAVSLAKAGKFAEDELDAAQLKKLPCIVVKGKGNYKESHTFYFSIAPADMNDASNGFAASPEEFFYEYAEKKGKAAAYKPAPAVSGTVGGKTRKLASGKDYKITYYKAALSGGNYQYDGSGLLKTTGAALEGGISEVGKYVVRIDGIYDDTTYKGNYNGTLTVKAEVTNKKLINKASVSYKKSLQVGYGYTAGTGIVQNAKDVTVKVGGKVLTKDTDYTISYADNRAVGTATMTITGKGNYYGAKSVTFKIVGYKLNKMKTEGKITASFDYDGNRKTQSGLRFYYLNGKTKQYLNTTTHYTITYESKQPDKYGYANVLPGTVTVVYTGKNAFAGSVVKKTFKIVGVATSKIKINNFPKSAFVYNGCAQTIETSNAVDEEKMYFTYQASKNAAPVIVPVLTEAQFENNESGVLVRYITDRTKKGNNTEVGSATVEIVGSGLYAGTVKKSVKIVAFDATADAAKANASDRRISVTYDDSVLYEKGGVKPEVTVRFRDADGNTAVLDGKSYTVKYKNNTAVNDGTNLKKLPTIQLSFKGNFKGGITKTFIITAGAFDEGAVTVTALDKAFANKAGNFATSITVTDKNGAVLKAGTDYDSAIAYKYGQAVKVKNSGAEADRAVGDAVVPGDIVPALDGGTRMIAVVTGKGNYTATSVEATFCIREGDLSKAKVVFNKSFSYSRGEDVKPSKDDFKVQIKTARGYEDLPATEYEIVEGSYKNNTKVGTASFEIRGVNNTAGKLTVKYGILPRLLSHLFG